MFRKMLILLAFTAVCFLFCLDVFAQDRKSVSAGEVNGTFQFSFKGKYKDFKNEIKILALGKGKIKISFDLVYPFLTENGEMMVNFGNATGIAEIKADQAVYTSENEYSDGQCKITIKFVKPGEIKVEQTPSDATCGFGHRVTADGTYKKISAKKPVFGELN